MEEQNHDDVSTLQVAVTFHDAPPTSLLLNILDVCEQEVYQLQRSEMEVALEFLDDLPGYVKSLCRRRFDETRGSALRYTQASNGSIILFATLTAIGYWIIQNTIGETIKGAYLETGMHKRLTELLLSRSAKQAKELESALTGRLVRYTSDAPLLIDIKTTTSGNEHVVHVSVTMSVERQRDLPPTIDTWQKNDDASG